VLKSKERWNTRLTAEKEEHKMSTAEEAVGSEQGNLQGVAMEKDTSCVAESEMVEVQMEPGIDEKDNSSEARMTCRWMVTQRVERHHSALLDCRRLLLQVIEEQVILHSKSKVR